MWSYVLYRMFGSIYLHSNETALQMKGRWESNISEWGNFLLNFHGQYVTVHKNKTTTSMHILIKGPPSFSGPDQQILLPPLGGVWPRPGSGILVYLPPGLGHPRTPPPPPPHQDEWPYPPYFPCVYSFRWPLPYTLRLFIF